MRVGPQEIAEKLLLLCTHTALGIFLSGVLGLLLYIVLVPIVQSFWSIADINFALMGVLTIGFGASVGSFLGWLNRDLSRSTLLLILLLTLAVTLMTAWAGLNNSRDMFKHVGKPGIPALTGIVVGAILGGNALNMVLWTVRTVRDPRL
jgi:FtsH-binding integral membrane protein